MDVEEVYREWRQIREAAEADANRNTTFLIAGPSTSGKDEAAYILSKITGLRYEGSLSWMALPYMAERTGLPRMLCWEKRHDMWEQWKNFMNEYRKEDPLRLIKYGLARADILTGIRELYELRGAIENGLVSCSVFISRPGTLVDPTLEIKAEDCDFQLLNDGDFLHLEKQVREMAKSLHLELKT